MRIVNSPLRPRLVERLPQHGGQGRPLPSLAGSGVADRFRIWIGASGRRYVFSVFPAGEERGLADVAAQDAPLVAIAVTDGRPDIVAIAGGSAAPLAGYEAVLARRGGEMHLLLTATSTAECRRIAADLTDIVAPQASAVAG